MPLAFDAAYGTAADDIAAAIFGDRILGESAIVSDALAVQDLDIGNHIGSHGAFLTAVPCASCHRAGFVRRSALRSRKYGEQGRHIRPGPQAGRGKAPRPLA